jgi:hypothetical protein
MEEAVLKALTRRHRSFQTHTWFDPLVTEEERPTSVARVRTPPDQILPLRPVTTRFDCRGPIRL